MAEPSPTWSLPAYPGRVVVVGAGTDGRALWCYAITGRSPASRDRTVVAGPEELRVVPTDTIGPDALRHYACVVRRRRWTVVGNGDHVEALAARVGVEGRDPASAFADVDPEPDRLHTPRVAALVGPDGVWLARSTLDGHGRVRRHVTPVVLRPGRVWVLHTYTSDGVDVRPGPAPREVAGVTDSAGALAALWATLDPRFRVLGVAGDLDGADPSAPLHLRS